MDQTQSLQQQPCCFDGLRCSTAPTTRRAFFQITSGIRLSQGMKKIAFVATVGVLLHFCISFFVVQVLGSMTQSAMLHVRGARVCHQRVSRALQVGSLLSDHLFAHQQIPGPRRCLSVFASAGVFCILFACLWRTLGALRLVVTRRCFSPRAQATSCSARSTPLANRCTLLAPEPGLLTTSWKQDTGETATSAGCTARKISSVSMFRV